MTPPPLVFRRVEVRRMPGIEPPGFAVEGLTEGINIVHGPNGAGKTTLARALQALLWPDRAAPEHADARGHFDWDEDNWLVTLNAAGATFQRNGSGASRPPMPGADQRDRYNLSLHQLIQQQTRNQDFAELILRESAGGYDLGEAEERIDLRVNPSRANQTLDRVANNAIEDLRESRSRARSLEDEKNRLENLRERRKQARRATERRELIDQALEYVRARSSLEEARERLSELPSGLEEVSGDEIEQLEQLDEEIDKLEREHRKNEARIDEAQDELERVGLAEQGLPGDLLTRCKNLRDRLASLEENQANHRQHLEEKREERSRERSQLGDDVSDEKLENLDGAGVQELADFARRSEEIRSQRTQLEALRSWLEPEDPPDDQKQIQEGSRLLRRWLRGSGGGDGFGRLQGRVVGGCLFLALIAGGAGYANPNLPFLQPVSLVLVLISFGVLLYGWMNVHANNLREATQREYADLDLPAPSEWTSDAVRSTLRELREQLSRARLAEEKTHRWEQRREELERLRQEESDLEKRRQQLVERFGTAPDTDASTLYWTVHRISRWQDAHHRVEALEEKIEQATNQHRETLSALNEILRRYGEDEAEDAAEAGGRISRLEQRSNDHRDASRTLEQARREQRRLEEQLEEKRTAREKLFTDHGLEVGDRGGLSDLCEQREDHAEARREVETARRVFDREEKRLREHPQFDPALLDRSEGELLNEKRRLEEEAGQYEELQERISGIEARIEEAKSTHDVEEALNRRNRALDRLADQYTSDYEALVARKLVEHLRSVSHDRERPEVFKQARRMLSTITGGKYRLKVDERGDSPGFRAVDTASREGYDLDQLSSGTRLQVLLAVRMAFVRTQESGAGLPLIMDETLANTDDTRARSIIESTLELSRAGRQVFYFTAQGDEVAKWAGILENEPELPHRIIDLAEVRERSNAVEVPPLEDLTLEHREVPPPDGATHREYKNRISVAPFHPPSGAESAHLWYLVTDVNELHRLLNRGIERWGPLKTLLEDTGEEQRLVGETARQELRTNAAALEEFSECWMIGRGRRVDRATLEDSGAVTENFIEEVWALSKRVEGRAEAIIEALREGEVSGFRTQKMDELEAYFRQENYLDPAEPLDKSRIRSRMIVAVEQVGEDTEEAARRVDSLLRRLETRDGDV